MDFDCDTIYYHLFYAWYYMKRHNLDFLNKKYSEKELEKNINLFDEHDWWRISFCQKLSEQFIEKYLNKIDLETVSECQVLSEKFIEKYSDKLDWIYISECQKLSEQFIKKHFDKINIKFLMINEKISKKVKNKIKKEINLLKEII